MAINKIVVAEDEAIIALDIKSILNSYSYSVIDTVRSFNDVSKIVKEHPPDLLITSLTLKNSADYFDKIVSLQKEYNFYVLFLSGSMRLSEYQNKCDSNYFFFLNKPFDSKSLLESINLINEKSVAR
jgi:DNA-binding NtrC family response regulator